MMKSIRGNPQVLDMLEAESKMAPQMAAMMGEDGSSPDMKTLKEAGMDFDYHDFKEAERVEKMVKEEKAAAAEARKRMAEKWAS